MLIICGNSEIIAENITNEVKLFFKNCLNKSLKSEEILSNHILNCLENKSFKVQMPNQYNNILKIEKHHMRLEIHFRIYCDFETVNVKKNDQKFNQKPSAYSIVM